MARSLRQPWTLLVVSAALQAVLSGCGWFNLDVLTPQGGKCPNGAKTCSDINGGGQSGRQFQVIPAVTPVNINNCSTGFFIAVFENGTEANSSAVDLRLSVTGTSGAEGFLGANCAGPTQTVIPAGTTRVAFSYRSSTAGQGRFQMLDANGGVATNIQWVDFIDPNAPTPTNTPNGGAPTSTPTNTPVPPTSTPTNTPAMTTYEIRISPQPATLPNGLCHSGYIVRTYINNVQANPLGVTLNLRAPNEPFPVQFVTGSSCTPGGNQLVLAPGQTEGYVSIMAPPSVEGVRILRVRDQNTGGGTFGELVLSVNFTNSGNNPPTTATDIVLVGPGDADAGSCSPISVNAVNGVVPAILASPLAVTLSFSPTDPPNTQPLDVSGWYRNATCLDADRITATEISAGSSSRIVWFSTKRALDYLLTGKSGQMVSTIQHRVHPLATGPKSVRITSLSDSTTAGRCIPGIATLTDVFGNALPSAAQVAIQVAIPLLSPVTSPAIYTDASCSVAAANRTIQVAPTQSSASFFFRVDVASNAMGYRIEPTAAGYDTIPRYIVVLPANAAQLVIDSVPSSIDADFAGSCVNLVVALEDMYGNRTRNTTNGPMTIKLEFEPDLTSPDPSDLSRAWLTAGFDCPGTRPTGGRDEISIQIPDGGDNTLASMVFYDAGTATVKASKTLPSLPAVAQGRFAVPPPFVVLPGDPAVARIVPRPVGAPPPRAGECLEVQYQLFDAYDNLTHARTNTPMQVQFSGYGFPNRVPQVSLNSNCSNPITPPNSAQPWIVNITALANTQGGKFYVTHTVAETFRILVTGPSAVPPISASPEVLITFVPNVPRQVVYLPESAPRGRELECSLPIVLEVRDQYGNPSAPTTPLDFTLVKKSSTVAGAVITFSADNACSVPSTNFQLVNSSRKTFYAQTSVAGVYEIEARVTTAGWPYSGFPYPVHVFSVLANQMAQNLPVAVDFFGAAGPLPSGGIRAGAKMGPFVLKPLNRASTVVNSDQNVTVRIDGRTVINRAPMGDLKVYQASTTSCSSTLIPTREVQILGGQNASQPFCISGEVAGARELVPVAPIFVGVRLAIVVSPANVSQFRFLVKSGPAVGRCSPVTLETRDSYNNLSPIIALEDDPTQELAAIVEVYNLTTGADIYNDRNCYDRIASGELTFPSGTSRVGFYLLSTAVANGSAIPVAVSARTVDPNLGVATSATIPLANGYPSNRTLIIQGIGYGAFYTTNVCRNATLKLVQQNNSSPDPNTWAVVTYPGSGDGQVSFGSAVGAMYLGDGCVAGTGGGQVVSKVFNKGDQGILPFSWRTGTNSVQGILGAATYAGRLLHTEVSFQMTAGACTPGTYWDAPAEYVPIGGGYFVYLYKRYYCDYGNWVLVAVSVSRLNAGCFAPESQIATAGGLPKRADLVREGDELWNPVTRQPVKVLHVVKGPEKAGLIEIRAGGKLSKLSQEHPMVTDRGIKMAQDVVRGDKLRMSDGQFRTVATVRRLAPREGQFVYNFVLDLPETATAESKLISGDGFVTGEWTLQKALRENRDARKGELP